MSYEICKSIKVIPAPDDPGKWALEIVGHSNNIYPRRDSHWVTNRRYESDTEAMGLVLLDCYDGGIRGANRFSCFIDELRYNIVKSGTFERIKMLDRLRSKMFDAKLAYSPNFIKQEGVKKSEEKAERAHELVKRLYARMEKLFRVLAWEMLAWKPNKERYHVRLDTGRYVVSYGGGHRFWHCSERNRAKVFSRLAAEKFRARFNYYQMELVEI